MEDNPVEQTQLAKVRLPQGQHPLSEQKEIR